MPTLSVTVHPAEGAPFAIHRSPFSDQSNPDAAASSSECMAVAGLAVQQPLWGANSAGEWVLDRSDATGKRFSCRVAQKRTRVLPLAQAQHAVLSENVGSRQTPRQPPRCPAHTEATASYTKQSFQRRFAGKIASH
eukprot:275890-Chlamydomonas_euryale.AAC.1